MGPREHAVRFVSLFLFSIPLWLTLKLNLWNSKMYTQFILALTMIFIFIGLGYFVDKKVRPRPIGLYMNESKAKSIFGALLINLGLLVYGFLWFYTLL